MISPFKNIGLKNVEKECQAHVKDKDLTLKALRYHFR